MFNYQLEYVKALRMTRIGSMGIFGSELLNLAFFPKDYNITTIISSVLVFLISFKLIQGSYKRLNIERYRSKSV